MTLNQCIDVYRGSCNKKVSESGSASNPYHGSGKNISKVDADRLFKLLVIQRALVEHLQSNKAGFVHAYLKIGPNASKVLSGEVKIRLQKGDEIEQFKRAKESENNRAPLRKAADNAASSKRFKWPKRTAEAKKSNKRRIPL